MSIHKFNVLRKIENVKIGKTKTGKEKKIYTFSYCYKNGKPITDEKQLSYVRSMAIPPAYTKVEISTDPEASYSYIGKDSKGKKTIQIYKIS